MRPSRVTARCTWPTEAAAIGSGDQSRNTFSGGAPSSSDHDPRGEHGRHRRRIGLQGGERLLGIFRERFDDEADELGGLHQRALHLPQLPGHVLSRRDDELLVELVAPTTMGRHPAGLHDRPTGTVASGQAPDPGAARGHGPVAQGRGRSAFRPPRPWRRRQPRRRRQDRRDEGLVRRLMRVRSCAVRRPARGPVRARSSIDARLAVGWAASSSPASGSPVTSSEK